MKRLTAIALLTFLASNSWAGDAPNALQNGATWDDLSYDIVGDAQVQDGSAVFDLDAPYRAYDAATVPVTFSQPDGAPEIRKLTLIVDENPAPVVAEFEFGPMMGQLALETRVRVDRYSNVRAIAETDDGLYMTGRYVKASGGCSAPALKDAEAAMAAMGQMKLREFGVDGPTQSGQRREAQIMIRHPNYSGLQRNQVTHLFIGAHFVDDIEVWQGDDMLFHLTGGISISEDPSFRFSYTDNGSDTIRVKATDTEGNVFEHEFPKENAAT
jgi:sulfur-oxidizing protein SoxY